MTDVQKQAIADVDKFLRNFDLKLNEIEIITTKTKILFTDGNGQN